jgi:hypothetical protein
MSSSSSKSTKSSKHAVSAECTPQGPIPAGVRLTLAPTSRQVDSFDFGSMTSYFYSPVTTELTGPFAAAGVGITTVPQVTVGPTGATLVPAAIAILPQLVSQQFGLNTQPLLLEIVNNSSCTQELKLRISSDCKQTRDLLRDIHPTFNVCPGMNRVFVPSSQIAAALAAGFGAAATPSVVTGATVAPSGTTPIELQFSWFTCDKIFVLSTKTLVYANYVDYFVATVTVQPSLLPINASPLPFANAIVPAVQTPGLIASPNSIKTNVPLYVYTFSGVVTNNSKYEVRNGKLFWDSCIQKWTPSNLKSNCDGDCKDFSCGCYKELHVGPFEVVDDCGCEGRIPCTFRLGCHNKIFFCVKITSRTVIVAPVLHLTGSLEVKWSHCKDVPFHVASPNIGEDLLDVQSPSFTVANQIV